MQSAPHPVPYVPFRTFLTALEGLERNLPSQLDRSIWPSYSGAIQGQLLGAFRFLGLIDAEQAPTAELREMLARPEARKVMLRRILERTYAPVVALDLARASPRQLDDALRQYGLGGATHKKAVSFFLQAAQYAGIPLSVLLRGKVRGPGPGRPAPRRAQAPAAGESAPPTARTVRLRSGGTLTVSAAVDWFALSPEDRELIFELIDRLRRYET